MTETKNARTAGHVPRVAVCGIFVESNAFCKPFRFTEAEGSICFEGSELSAHARSDFPRVHKEVAGFFRRMDETGQWEAVPILYAGMKPAGPADQVIVERLIDQIVAGIKAAAPLDAIYIANHGAMTATEDEDIEGTMAARIRAAAGPIPIVATLDLHANVSDRQVDALDLVVAYRSDPHVDQFECGQEAADGLRQLLAGVRTELANIRLPLVAPNVSLATDDGPYGEVIALGQRIADRSILNVSVLAGFAYGDTTKNGMHVIVTGRRGESRAAEVVQQVATHAWDNRKRFDWNLVPIADAVREAVKVGREVSLPPLALIDLGDNAGAGGPANTLWMLCALHEAGAQDALVANFFDPALVEAAWTAGEGATFAASFTGDDFAGAPQRFSADAEVLALHDAPVTGRMGIAAGRTLYAGRSCLLRVGPLLVTVNSRPTTLNDPVYVEMLGIRPGSFRSLIIKGRGSTYKVSWTDYFPPDREAILVDTPGRTSPVLTRFDWQRLPRPCWPLDRDVSYSVPEAQLRPGPASLQVESR